MREFRKSYKKKDWVNFSNRIIHRDNYQCTKCNRGKDEVTLQAHHTSYIEGREIWDYPLSDLITLCKGCHAVEHGIIEPSFGWTLVAISDLGYLIGECEREGCGATIRYEHEAYHPLIGYKVVGSTCIEFITRNDQLLSEKILKIFKSISSFVHKSKWESYISTKGKHYLAAKHNHNQIRIYGKVNFSIQIALKVTGEKWYDYQDFIRLDKRRSLAEAKELGFIVLKGITSNSESEKKILRNIYRRSR